MSFTSTKFIINGVNSDELGITGIDEVCLIRENNTIERQIMGSRSVVEDEVGESLSPLFYKLKKSPIELKLMFSVLNNAMTHDVQFQLAEIFSKDYYVPFQSYDDLNKVYYVVATDIKEVTFGLYEGWIEVSLRTSSTCAWTPIQEVTFDITSVPTNIELFNNSNVVEFYYPEIEVTLTDSNTEFTFVNTSDNNRVFGFTDLNANEVITIFNEGEGKIISDSGDPRFSKLIDKRWFRLIKGSNIVTVDKKCSIKIKYQYPIYA